MKYCCKFYDLIPLFVYNGCVPAHMIQVNENSCKKCVSLRQIANADIRYNAYGEHQQSKESFQEVVGAKPNRKHSDIMRHESIASICTLFVRRKALPMIYRQGKIENLHWTKTNQFQRFFFLFTLFLSFFYFIFHYWKVNSIYLLL